VPYRNKATEAIMVERESSLLAEETQTSPKEERRAWVRYPFYHPTECQAVAAETATEPEIRWPAVVRDISSGGLRLSLTRRFEPGTTLIVELPTRSAGRMRALPVRVVHVRARLDGCWTTGCQFASPLDEHELQSLL
jgi:hypothetical protein